MSTTPILILILFLIQCFTPISSLAIVINITDTNTSSERVIQSTIYRDDTILLRLVNQTNGCSDNVVKLKLIRQDGTIRNLTIAYNKILAENFCVNNTSFNQENNIEGGIPLDGIKIYALQPQWILLTYFCKIEQATNIAEMCGLIINWNGEIKSDDISFGQTCANSIITIQNLINNNGEFLRTCYVPNQLIWTRYVIGQNGQIRNTQNSTINKVSQFSSHFLFPSGGGGYGIIYYADNQLTLNFIIPLSSTSDNASVNGPFQLYRPTQNISSLNIFKCGTYVEFGYNCLMSYNGSMFVNINFLDSGSIVTTDEFSLTISSHIIIKVESLYYGGYAILTRDVQTQNLNGTIIVSNNGTVSRTLDMRPNVVGINFGVFSNNTIWNITISDGLKLITDDILTNYFPSTNGDISKQQRLKNFGNSFIESVFPPSNGNPISIPSPFTINVTFTNLIDLANGNISIWQYSEGGIHPDTLRQSFSGNQPILVHKENDSKTVSITVLNSTFNIPGARYYVSIDDGFVKDLRTGQGLLGIRPNRWSIRTDISSEGISAGTVSSLVRLTPAGTASFLNQNKKDFVKQMTQELSRTIPIDPASLSIPSSFQFDTDTIREQIFLRMDVNYGSLAAVNSGISKSRIISDLNVLIVNKSFTGIGKGNYSNMLDDTFGSVVISK